jgi:NAD(P)-dependent dehydrogenase (short-subunit alcohol dehydrogenase family)
MNETNSPAGRVCIVTGSNSGIGKAAAMGLARCGSTVVMVCRNLERGKVAQAEIIGDTGNKSVDLMVCDLSSQRSIRQFAAEFKAKYNRLHVLIHNAANFDQSLRHPVITEDGVETVFATNHLGPFLMTNLLLETLKAGAPSRVLTVASKGLITYPFLSIEYDNLNGQKKFSAQHAYYHSKLAQVIFTFDLAERLKGSGVTVNCIRVTNVQLDKDRYEHITGWKRRAYELKRRMAITPKQMAEAYIRLAVAPEFENVTGKYFDEKCGEVRANKGAYDQASWHRLWQVSESLTGLVY